MAHVSPLSLLLSRSLVYDMLRFTEIVNFHWMQCFFGNVCISGASVFGSLACSVYPRSSHKVSRPIREAVPCPIFFMVPSLLDRATLVCAANRLRLRYVRMEWTTVGQNHVFTFFLLLYVFRLRMRFFTVISLVYPSNASFPLPPSPSLPRRLHQVNTRDLHVRAKYLEYFKRATPSCSTCTAAWKRSLPTPALEAATRDIPVEQVLHPTEMASFLTDAVLYIAPSTAFRVKDLEAFELALLEDPIFEEINIEGYRIMRRWIEMAVEYAS
ncbi:uncharacterized protein BT62DRAFT_1006449 [Guyanagaster necrorhizus]|uniref:Uncharacterized protein n=1 Tax=Guyanagaster necrorhizus TaxID=856835 RepID=A0A9P7VRT5_9AGAR|nr:uncharacterized protein BT62DRAFT_1006449 [Guyanagaster necrorhizus MCA 3950]KAG7445493.1 hypothetical protein BT62DRAFT_1006449 [Guyanagaster necrorhizus MCA 3950]